MEVVLENSYSKISKRDVYLVTLILIAIFCFACAPSVCFADVEANLTDWFSTKSFHGTSEVFSKMNWVGQIMAYTISIFGILGLFTVGMRIMLTLLYLSGKNFWDNIDEIKSAGRGQKMFGMGALVKDTYNAQHGVGLDAFVSFFLSLFPNIKAYSDYSADAKHSMNLKEDDTVTTYLLKTALPNIMVILAFTMAWNGTLWKAYGVVVDGVGVVANTFVNTRLDTIVSKALNTGSNYQFGYSASNTEYGALKQKVAEEIYNQVIAKCDDVSTGNKQAVGACIDKKASNIIDAAALIALGYGSDAKDDGSTDAATMKKAINNGGYEALQQNYKTFIEDGVKNITDQDAKNLGYDVIVNKTSEYADAFTFKGSDLGIKTSVDKNGNEVAPYYVHLYVYRKANADYTYYFDPYTGDEDKEVEQEKQHGTVNVETVGQ